MMNTDEVDFRLDSETRHAILAALDAGMRLQENPRKFRVMGFRKIQAAIRIVTTNIAIQRAHENFENAMTTWRHQI